MRRERPENLISNAARNGRLLARPGMAGGNGQEAGERQVAGDGQEAGDRQEAGDGQEAGDRQEEAGIRAPGEAVVTGLRPLGLLEQGDTLLYVPAGYRPDRPAPLAVMLHGAGGNARHGMDLLQHLADANGLLLLAPESRDRTWDVLIQGYGPDIALIEKSLEWTLTRYVVDPRHIAVGGFSDGASYALSIGITNGDLFTHVVAFSPGFMAPAGQQGKPRVFISHGIQDAILPIDSCSRRLAPKLRQQGYDLLYQEFDGPHTVPPEMARLAMRWFTEDESLRMP